MNLSDANVLVTGGSSGIGLETAKRLQAKAARVAICGRNKQRLDSCGFDGLRVQADVSKEDDAVRLVNTVIDEFDDYNVLVNNAGLGTFAPLVEQTVEAFEQVVATNLIGAMLVARESAKHFVKRNGGTIINVGSTAGDKGFAYGTAYATSKFGLRGMTECWRAELRQHNVRVMLIKPSEVITEFAKSAGFPQEESDRKLQSEDIAHAILAMIEMNDRGFIPELNVFATNPP